MSEITIKTFSELSNDLENKVNNFRNNNPGMRNRKKTEKEKKIHADKYCSSSDIKKWVLAFDQDTVVGMIAVFQRNINFNNKNVVLGGIGKVRVATDMRKIGLGSKLMKRSMKVLTDLNCDVAFLCTDLESFLAKWYEKYGFVIMKKEYTYLGKSKKRYRENDGMLAPINSEYLFDEILNSNQILDLGIGNW